MCYQFEIDLIETNLFKDLFQLIFLTNKLIGMSNLNREIKLVILWVEFSYSKNSTCK